MYTFELIESHDPFLKRTSYGILAKKLEGSMVQEAAFVPRVSSDKDVALKLLERCNRSQCNNIHLLDIMTDALS